MRSLLVFLLAISPLAGQAAAGEGVARFYRSFALKKLKKAGKHKEALHYLLSSMGVENAEEFAIVIIHNLEKRGGRGESYRFRNVSDGTSYGPEYNFRTTDDRKSVYYTIRPIRSDLDNKIDSARLLDPNFHLYPELMKNMILRRYLYTEVDRVTDEMIDRLLSHRLIDLTIGDDGGYLNTPNIPEYVYEDLVKIEPERAEMFVYTGGVAHHKVVYTDGVDHQEFESEVPGDMIYAPIRYSKLDRGLVIRFIDKNGKYEDWSPFDKKFMKKFLTN